MSESRLDLKNRYLAAVLAFLIPGAGHLYQRRFFKAGIYGICILATFFYGMALGDWQVVYYRGDAANRPYGYFAQVWVGLPALPALVQYSRFDPAFDPDDRTTQWLRKLDGPIEAVPFSSAVVSGERQVAEVVGHLTLSETATPHGLEVQGFVEGMLHTEPGGAGEPVRLDVAGGFAVEPAVIGRKYRLLRIDVADSRGQFPEGFAAELDRRVRLDGSSPRNFADWFQAPLDKRGEDDLHRKLGTLFELAAVFTWIAGLLNILAIWDALEGPAYGMGDETPAPEGAESGSAPSPGGSPPVNAPAAPAR